MTADSQNVLSHVFDVLGLFLIPVGGGIPAGVIAAKNNGFAWPLTSAIYLGSDLILACVFEVILTIVINKSKTSPFLTQFLQRYREMLEAKGVNFGLKLNPFSLVVLSFGLDPMTGRVIARSAGHGFLSGWAIAICGDMVFFALIMVSTLVLNDILGSGFWAAFIITGAVIGVPSLIRFVKAKRGTSTTI